MSYAEEPRSNPYAAPTSKVDVGELNQPSGYVGYSGFWRRFAAYFIDYILMFVISLFGGFAIGVILALVAGQNFAQKYGGAFGLIFGLALVFRLLRRDGKLGVAGDPRQAGAGDQGDRPVRPPGLASAGRWAAAWG